MYNASFLFTYVPKSFVSLLAAGGYIFPISFFPWVTWLGAQQDG